jgi:hypothetical protein
MIPAMTSPPDPGKETAIVDVRGRNVVVRQLTDAQLLLLAREARLAQQPDTDAQRRLNAASRIFNILETAIVQEEDREYIMDLTVEGTLTLSDLTAFISVFGDEEDEKPKVRRGRAPSKRS